jgi:hypothetical protein
MDTGITTATARRAAMWGRVVALAIGIPIYFSLLTTLPALAATLLIGLYVGVPTVVRRVTTDPAHRATATRHT